MAKIITRIFGGIGNQLFCYAAARRLALANNAELVIDDVSGFIYDYKYRRKYQLDHFNIPCRKATAGERMAPGARVRRYLKRAYNRRRPFFDRTYIEQEGLDFDPRLLALKAKGTLYLDGYWQSEGYFKDVEQTICEDLRIIPPGDDANRRMAGDIRNTNAVALHVRWFDAPGSNAAHNVSIDYYRRAIALMDAKVKSPRYFLFSDDPEVTRAKLALPEGRMTCVSHNRGDENAYADLWLMTQCKHFIIANSTFSWWGAWLAEHSSKIIIAPGITLRGPVTVWNLAGQIPGRWLKL